MAEPALRRSSSDYVLITPLEGQTDAATNLPRPRFFLGIPLIALVDLLNAVVFTFLVAIHHVPGCTYLLILNYARSLFVLSAGLSPRIREKGYLIALCSLITLFSVLYDSNSLIQRMPFASDSDKDKSPNRLDKNPSIVLPVFLITHLAFALLHWLAFVFCVGVNKKRNPFGMNFHSSSFRQERVIEVDQQSIAPENASIVSVEQRSMLDMQDDSEEDDQDAIIDLPPTTPSSFRAADGFYAVRSRTSRQSLRHPDASYSTFHS